MDKTKIEEYAKTLNNVAANAYQAKATIDVTSIIAIILNEICSGIELPAHKDFCEWVQGCCGREFNPGFWVE